MRNTLTNSPTGVLVLEWSTDMLKKEINGMSFGDDSNVIITNAANKNIAVKDMKASDMSAGIITSDKACKEFSIPYFLINAITGAVEIGKKPRVW